MEYMIHQNDCLLAERLWSWSITLNHEYCSFDIPQSWCNANVLHICHAVFLRQGGPGMKGSAAYPKGFAKKLMNLHLAETWLAIYVTDWMD